MRFMAMASVSCASLRMEPYGHGSRGEAFDDRQAAHLIDGMGGGGGAVREFEIRSPRNVQSWRFWRLIRARVRLEGLVSVDGKHVAAC